LRDAAQAPEGLPEAAPQHVALIDTWNEQRLKRRNPEAEEPNGHTTAGQCVRHKQFQKIHLILIGNSGY
jgi:hypothetical protein